MIDEGIVDSLFFREICCVWLLDQFFCFENGYLVLVRGKEAIGRRLLADNPCLLDAVSKGETDMVLWKRYTDAGALFLGVGDAWLRDVLILLLVIGHR